MELLKNQFMQYFSREGAETLAKHAKCLSHPSHTILCEEGKTSDRVFLVLEGKVELTKKAAGTQQVVIAHVEEGGYFGELGVLDGSPRSARATSLSTVSIATIPRTPLLKTLQKEPLATSLQLFGKVLEHLRTTNERYVAEVSKKEKLHVIGEMASKIIHDFKTPIATIQLAASLIEQLNKEPDTQRRCQVILSQTKEIVAMVQGLLEFSQGQTPLKAEPVSVEALFEKFNLLNAEWFMRAQATLSILPLKSKILIDSNGMLRVLQNLTTNALEALPPGNGRVTLSARNHENGVELKIEDNGPGIPLEIQPTVFDPFVTVGKKNGIGLGLAIARSIVEAHKGRIWFKSTPTTGTAFYIWLPKG